MRAQEGQLDDPEDHKADHAVGGDPLVCRDLVFQTQITRPDGADHHRDGIAAIHRLDGKPEDCQDDPRYDGDIGPPESPACPGQHGERRVVYSANGPIGGDDDGDDQESDGDDDKRLAVG